jgi:hypothetical protein
MHIPPQNKKVYKKHNIDFGVDFIAFAPTRI